MLGKELRIRWARTAAVGLLGVLVGACVFGLPALASTSHPGGHSRHGKIASPGGKTGSSTANTQAADARVQAATTAAVQGLVNDGTINQHQASVIDGQINAGTVDDQQLVSSGILTASQMSAVDNALIQVKRSFATGPASSTDGNVASPGDKTGRSSAGTTQAADARIQAWVRAALQSLVTAGTIDQHQADAIQSQVESGSADPNQLVSSGVLTASQMSAVNNALVQVKQSFAAGSGG
jgi:competence protein ComGC